MSENRKTTKTRFSMVKKRHAGTLQKAKEEGKIDKEMIGLCDYISSRKNFFTSSGCSGRILLLGLLDKSKKNSYFHRKWHEKVQPLEVIKALKEPTKGEIWLKMEPFIIHIGTNSLENAKKILSLKDKSGIKRGGIITAKPGKFIVELIGTEELAVLVKRGNKILAPEEFIKETVLEADKKIGFNYARVKEFEKIVRKELL
ncbi:MAG: hypothetical protein QXK06_02405 [Candidatus Diapherotrites archaeon]